MATTTLTSLAVIPERVKKETWDKWAHADIAQQSKGGDKKMSREWLKSLVIDGGTRYGPNPYVIYSSGKVRSNLLSLVPSADFATHTHTQCHMWWVMAQRVQVSEKPEWRNYIGESDLKIPFYINYVFPTENFLVRKT